MRSFRVVHAAGLCGALGLGTWVATTGGTAPQSGQEEPAPSTRPAAVADDGVERPAGPSATQPARRRSARLILPWSALQDLTPRQEAAIRAIRAEILDQKDALDRLERERILEVLTDEQRQRVQALEAEREQQQREQRERQRERPRAERGTTRPATDESGEPEDDGVDEDR